MSGLSSFFFLEVASGDQDLLRVFVRLASVRDSICRVRIMAPRPIATARASMKIDLPFIVASHFRSSRAVLEL